MHSLKIITSTTRQGRKGIVIANWITKLAQESGKFNVELLDLAAIDLPFLDEPNHPRLKKYQHEHTWKWSRTIESSDAFIIVLGEYNYGFPAPIKNALDYLFNEWKYKPVAFVSYGGVSAGIRATQMLKQVTSALEMVPVLGSLTIPFFSKFITDEDEFNPEEIVTKSAHSMLAELERWSEVLKPMRG